MSKGGQRERERERQRETETEHEWWRGRERERGQRILSGLYTNSREPDTGLESTSREIMT